VSKDAQNEEGTSLRVRATRTRFCDLNFVDFNYRDDIHRLDLESNVDQN